MLENQLMSVDTIRAYVDRNLPENDDMEDRRCGHVHLYGVGMLAGMIAPAALRRPS